MSRESISTSVEEQVTSRDQSTSDDEASRIHHIGQGRESSAHPVDEHLEYLARPSLTAPSCLDHLGSRRRGARDHPGMIGQRRSRCVAFPASATTTPTSPTLDLDHHVTDLASSSMSPSQDPTTSEDSPTDTGSQSHHDQIVDPASPTMSPFGDRRAGGIVVEDHLSTQARMQLGFGVYPDHSRKIRSVTQPSARIDESRKPDADSGLPRGVERLDEFCDRSPDRVGPLRGVTSFTSHDGPVIVEANRNGFGPPDVDPDANGHDSARAANSRKVLRMRTSARRFTKPGNGTTSSMDKS